MFINLLGSIGQLYMLILLALLFLGSGLGVWGLISSAGSKSNANQKSNTKSLVKADNQNKHINNDQNQEKRKIGGIIMNNNGWFKLAIFSFVGILVSVVALGFVSTGINAGNSNAHLTHQQPGAQQYQGAPQYQAVQQYQDPMYGTNNMNTMSNMNSMGNMNTMSNMPQQGYMPQQGMPQQGYMQQQGVSGSMQVDVNYMMIMQQLNQMQQQLNMMQQNSGMSGGGGGGGGGMGMM